MISEMLKEMRIRQWAKNGFVLAALFFSQNMGRPEMVLKAVTAFFSFCLLSSGVYIFNDLCDLEQDRAHPTKGHRPLASGALSVPEAIVELAVLVVLGFWLAHQLNLTFTAIAGVYLVQNLLYSLWLKHVVILDVMLIALGFLLRAIAGAVALPVEISNWLILCTMMLALFLGFTKRRQELLILGEGAATHRQSLGHYSLEFLDQMISVVTASTVMSYALYTVSPEVIQKFGTSNLQFTIPFVLFGIFRYQFVTHVQGGGDNPTRVLFSDRQMQINIVLWALTVGLILYL